MEIRVRRAIRFAVGVAAALVFLASPAQAATLLPGVNYSTVDTSGGILVIGGVQQTLTNEILGGGEDHGSLTTTVYTNAAGNLYTYEVKITPKVDQISLVSTSFAPAAFNGVAGWSFTNVTDAGSASAATAFGSYVIVGGVPVWQAGVQVLASGALEWDQDLANEFWGPTEPIRFFFQSSYAPGTATFGVYNMSNATLGSAVGLAPNAALPEPGPLLLLSTGLAGAGVLARWGRKNA